MVDRQVVTWMWSKHWIISGKVLLSPGKQRYWELVPTLQHLCSQSRTLDQESEPNASVKCRGTIRRDSHWRSWALAKERPRKPISPGRYGLFYEVAGSLRHSQSRGFSSDVCASYKLILSLWNSTGATKWPWTWFRVSSDTEGFATPGSEQDAHQAPETAVGRHGGALHQNSRLIPPEIWDARLPIFLLAYRTYTHDTTGWTSASLVLGRELQIPWDLGHNQTRNDPQSIMQQM
jgi:hypothetical protein